MFSVFSSAPRFNAAGAVLCCKLELAPELVGPELDADPELDEDPAVDSQLAGGAVRLSAFFGFAVRVSGPFDLCLLLPSSLDGGEVGFGGGAIAFDFETVQAPP